MPLLQAEVDRLNLPDLKMEILETQIIRGAPFVFARIPFMQDDADTLRLTWEANSSVTSSLADPADALAGSPYSCTTAADSRDSVSQDIGWKHMRRHADVIVLHTFDKRYFDKKRVELRKQSKYIVEDWADQLLNGLGNGLQFAGVEFYLEYMVSTLGLSNLKQYNTDDGLVTGVPQVLGLSDITTGMMQMRCGQYAAIISDLTTFVHFRGLIESAGGNTAPMLMAQNFGVNIFSHGQYNGVPWIVYAQAGRAKATAEGQVTATDATLNIDTTAATGDPYWIGFNDLDVGRQITVGGAGAGGADHVTTIASVTDFNTVEMADVAVTTVAADATVAIPATRVLYFTNFDEDDGFHYRHPEKNGSMPKTVGKCLPSVGGMAEINIGILQDCEVERVRVRAYGNFANTGVDSLCRVSHFTTT